MLSLVKCKHATATNLRRRVECQGRSDCLKRQVFCLQIQGLFSLSMALRMSSSFLMQAVNAVIFALPRVGCHCLACPAVRITSKICHLISRRYPFSMPLRKPHRKRGKHLDGRGETHELTFPCPRRRRLLDYERAKEIVLGVLNSQKKMREKLRHTVTVHEMGKISHR